MHATGRQKQFRKEKEKWVEMDEVVALKTRWRGEDERGDVSAATLSVSDDQGLHV